jgi:glutamate dehydrogenase (NAD(P)+)
MCIHVDDIRPQLICEVQDEELGRLGYLVIDRALGNVAIGGIRQAPNVTIEEVACLARAMTLKCSFLKLWMGGAKAGITAPESLITAKRREVLAAFGHSLGPLLRTNIYVAGEDLGISAEDLDIIREGAGLPRVTARTGSYYTALTVVEAIRQAVISQKGALAGSTVAIEGFGRVGSSVAELLARQGAGVVAVSTLEGAIYNPSGLDVEQLVALRNLHGDHVVAEYRAAEKLDLADLLLLDVDVLVPCARPWTISAANVTQVRAEAVVPGANIPVTPSAEKVLFDRGILCLPDFVANCGGVLAASLTASGFRREDIESIVRQEFALAVSRVLKEAGARNAMPSEVAREMAWQNFRQMARQVEHEEHGIGHLLRKAVTRDVRASLKRGAILAYRRGLLRWDSFHHLALADMRETLFTDESPP